MPKTKYKYTCMYCDYQWELSYGIKNNTCGICRDKNIKLEEVRTVDYYGTEDRKKEKEDDPFSDWRD